MYEPRESKHITPEHFAAFGRILHAFARIESLYEAAILTALNLQPYQAALTLSQYGYEQKRQLLFVIIDDITNGSDDQKRRFKKLIENIGQKSALRNNVAHCVWRQGRKEGTIKPFVVKTKARLLLLGSDADEKEWTADELHSEADEILGRASAFKKFLIDYGMFPRIDSHKVYE